MESIYLTVKVLIVQKFFKSKTNSRSFVPLIKTQLLTLTTAYLDISRLSVLVSLQCSVPCGLGQKSREVRCVSNVGDFVPDEECNMNLRPSDVENCDMGPCAKSWFYTEWGSRVGIRPAVNGTHNVHSLFTQWWPLLRSFSIHLSSN